MNANQFAKNLVGRGRIMPSIIIFDRRASNFKGGLQSDKILIVSKLCLYIYIPNYRNINEYL